eukprot:g3317.t1
MSKRTKQAANEGEPSAAGEAGTDNGMLVFSRPRTRDGMDNMPPDYQKTIHQRVNTMRERRARLKKAKKAEAGGAASKKKEGTAHLDAAKSHALSWKLMTSGTGYALPGKVRDGSNKNDMLGLLVRPYLLTVSVSLMFDTWNIFFSHDRRMTLAELQDSARSATNLKLREAGAGSCDE